MNLRTTSNSHQLITEASEFISIYTLPTSRMSQYNRMIRKRARLFVAIYFVAIYLLVLENLLLNVII